jgi:hypothetical protein
MKKAIEIVKSYLIPKLQKINNFDSKSLNDYFWNEFTMALLTSETDSKPLYQLILNLELNSEIKEKIISKIPKTYSLLIAELAEEKVKGDKSEAISILLNSNVKSFKDEVTFIENMNEAFEILETKKRIIAELPFMYKKLQNDISNEDI